ncbi:MAG: hypothetical protein M0Z78_03640 [Betaproteobacteria bacterium]|jgi:hypothetical protein|nr:hypothetical protein [Betaproteobacteria bacterium]
MKRLLLFSLVLILAACGDLQVGEGFGGFAPGYGGFGGMDMGFGGMDDGGFGGFGDGGFGGMDDD